MGGGGGGDQVFFFNDTATTEIYTLSLHDALPIFPILVAEWLAEVCIKNRIIPIVFIILVFYLIPLVLTWSSIAKAFGKE